MPKWFDLAKKELGTKEWPGRATNPRVQGYFVDAVSAQLADSVPWCAAFVGAMLKRAGIKPSRSLMARSYLTWGKKISKPVPGAIVVLRRGRPPSGHVAFFDSFVGRASIRVIGGNQRNAVTYSVYPTASVLGYRWPKEV